MKGVSIPYHVSYSMLHVNSMPLHFQITTPARTLVKDEVDSVTIPTRMGEVTILPHHIPLVAVLEPGELIIRKNGTESYFAVGGGYVEVQSGNKLTILADSAERAEELDAEKIEAARERARNVMKEKIHVDDVAYAGAAAALERELARLKVVRRRSRAPRAAPP